MSLTPEIWAVQLERSAQPLPRYDRPVSQPLCLEPQHPRGSVRGRRQKRIIWVSHPPDVPVRVRQSRRAVDTALRKLLILRIGWV